MNKLRVINWNIARHPPNSWQAISLTEEIASLAPDLVCLTEAWSNSLAKLSGYAISAPGLAWSEKAAEERKVMLWSRSRWMNVEIVDDLEAVGCCVTGITQFEGAPIRIVGVCIPYAFANPFGQRPKAKMWELHELFLHALKPRIEKWKSEGSTIVLGDFNRRMPRSRGAIRPYKLLESTFADLNVVTSGVLAEVNDQTVDHIAVSRDISAGDITGISSGSPDGRQRSDHFGVLADLSFTSSNQSKNPNPVGS